ncbi:adenylate/guanylate cyclase domain-containing protein [Candidatus Riflebacteria bacterium]
MERDLSYSEKGAISYGGKFLTEFLTNSGFLLIFVFLMESLTKGFFQFFKNSSHWALIMGCFVQTFLILKYKEKPYGVYFNCFALFPYAFFDILGEGIKEFFSSSLHHYIIFYFLGITLLKKIKGSWDNILILILESLIKTHLILILYINYELKKGGTGEIILGFKNFFSEAGHVFLFFSFVILGILIGVHQFLTMVAESKLKILIEKLGSYSEWFLGRETVMSSLDSEETFKPTMKNLSVLFMDLRGFTRWSEANEPENVARMLNEYYTISEKIIEKYGRINKFVADEISASFKTEEKALACAMELMEGNRNLVSEYGITAGIGINHGPVIMGLIGVGKRKDFTLVSDVVNVAKRLESQSKAFEVVVPENWEKFLKGDWEIISRESVHLKGKSQPFAILKLSPSPTPGKVQEKQG